MFIIFRIPILMVAKNTDDERFCSSCLERPNCKKIYQQLANAKGPSVALKALGAFLVPIAVFIGSLVIFQEIFAGIINDENTLTAASFAVAAAITVIFILIVKAINSKFAKTNSLSE